MSSVIVLGRVRDHLYAEEHQVPLEQVRYYRAGLGGPPVNITVGLESLGVRVCTTGAVSGDALGRFLLRSLIAEKVDTCCVQLVRGRNVSLCFKEVSAPRCFHQGFYRTNIAGTHTLRS